MEKICICGGGALGHVIAGKGASLGFHVSILTRHPEQWQQQLVVDDCNGNVFQGQLAAVSSNPAEVIPEATVILLCLPGFAIEEELLRIKPYISPNTYIGSVVCCTGFFFMAYRLLGEEIPLFGFQRAPYIARVDKYGCSAHLLGYKKELQIATMNISDPERLGSILEEMMSTPVRLLANFLEASLTNSNPLLHPVRLYAMFRNWHKGDIYPEIPGFYNTWDDESSSLLIACDEEFHKVLSVLPVVITPIPTLLDYYESHDAASLTRKIRSIVAFQPIPTPMKAEGEGYIPDFGSRYFLEDFPFGLLIIKSVAEIMQIDTPHIDEVLIWGQRVIGKNYMRNGRLSEADLRGTGYITAELFYKMIKA